MQNTVVSQAVILTGTKMALDTEMRWGNGEGKGRKERELEREEKGRRGDETMVVCAYNPKTCRAKAPKSKF